MQTKKTFAPLAALFFLIALAFAGRVLSGEARGSRSNTLLPTYYSYTKQEIEELKNLSSTERITPAALKNWDKNAQEFVQTHQLDNDKYDSLRFYTYLYVAEREAAFLSYNVKGEFFGSINSLALAIFCLFIPDYAPLFGFETDAYSEKLKNIIFPRLKDRFERENALNFMYPVPEEYVDVKDRYYTRGRTVAKWIPWQLAPSVIYYPPPPYAEGDPRWAEEIEKIKKTRLALDEKKKKIISFWAGHEGPDSGEWRKMANDYMFEHKVLLEKMLQVRAALLMGLYDASIAYLGAKYHYYVLRPKQRDPSITYLIDLPNHPSYPAGHAVLAGTAATILSCYFPTETHRWKKLAEESGNSRIWAEIHYPSDIEEGYKMGEKIGHATIEKAA